MSAPEMFPQRMSQLRCFLVMRVMIWRDGREGGGGVKEVEGCLVVSSLVGLLWLKALQFSAPKSAQPIYIV